LLPQIEILFLPFLACLILTGIHVYLGIHVISRKVIFVDIALAQIAALGAATAFVIGYPLGSAGAYFMSLGFAVVAAVVFALTRTEHERVPQEAVIGLAYATAAAAAILLADISPHGAEHLHDLLAGSIVWVTPEQIIKTTILYAVIGIFHFVFRKRFLLISLHPHEAYAQGINVRFWDFLFYLSFGVVITSSVQIAGVLLVFCYLVAPSVFAVMFFDDLRRRLITGWAMAIVVSAVGLLFSYDRPSGPTIMVCFAVALILGGLLKATMSSPSRRRTLGVASIVAAVSLIAWLVFLFRPTSPLHAGEDFHLAHSAEVRDEAAHPLDDGMDDLRSALRDSHESVRAEAVARLAATGDPRVVPDLVGALHDQDVAVREAAAVALAHLGPPAALPALKQALRNADEDEWVRIRMAQAVAGMGDVTGIPVLLGIARGGDAGLARIQALQTLSQVAGMSDLDLTDPGSTEWAARLDQLDAWWQEGHDTLSWDEATHTFRR
jgi:zinc/manganese transport system permease protein